MDSNPCEELTLHKCHFSTSGSAVKTRGFRWCQCDRGEDHYSDEISITIAVAPGDPFLTERPNVHKCFNPPSDSVPFNWCGCSRGEDHPVNLFDIPVGEEPEE